MQRSLDEAVVCIIGLGYVGLPLAEALAKKFKTIGFDIDSKKVKKLEQNNIDQNLVITDSPKQIGQADFDIVCVPTPLTEHKEPDLSYVESAARIVGQNMKEASVVILESTVYPGVTEEMVVPILEKESGLKCGEGFRIAYSPERINPGDSEHALDKVTKVIAGMDEETTELVAALYSKVMNIFKAKDIKTAEAAKVIENIQRDLNIALMNELSCIFEKMSLSTEDILETAATKWNFHRYLPGLVGGHCIPVDPYYLVYKAKELGYHPQVILAGRAINDYMPKRVVEMTIKALSDVGKMIKGSKLLILGLTYKANVPDIRESQVREIIKELEEYQTQVFGFDPLLDAGELQDEFRIKLFSSLKEASREKFDGIILCVDHSAFRGLSLAEIGRMQSHVPVLIDTRGMFSRDEAKKLGFNYKSL